MAHIFGSGPHKGKNVARLALTDYLHLKNLLSYRKGGTDDLTLEIEDVVHKLNNFVPQIRCQDGCNKTAEYLTIIVERGKIYNPYKGEDIYTVTGLSVSPIYAWCEEHKDRTAYTSKAIPYEIKFDTLEVFRGDPKNVTSRVLDALVACTGFSGKKTNKRCEDLINNLPQK